MSLCVPYAIAALRGDCSLRVAHEARKLEGWTPAGATPFATVRAMRRLGMRVTYWDGPGWPAHGLVCVGTSAGPCHAVAVYDGHVADLQDPTLPTVEEWLERHRVRYPVVFGRIEIAP